MNSLPPRGAARRQRSDASGAVGPARSSGEPRAVVSWRRLAARERAFSGSATAGEQNGEVSVEHFVVRNGFVSSPPSRPPG